MKTPELKSSFEGKDLSARTIVIRCLLSFWVLLSLRAHFEVGTGLETGSFLAGNLSKFANQFYYDGLADAFVFAAIYMLVSFAAKRHRRDPWVLLLALLFAAFYLISSVCRDVGDFSFFFCKRLSGVSYAFSAYRLYAPLRKRSEPDILFDGAPAEGW